MTTTSWWVPAAQPHCILWIAREPVEGMCSLHRGGVRERQGGRGAAAFAPSPCPTPSPAPTRPACLPCYSLFEPPLLLTPPPSPHYPWVWLTRSSSTAASGLTRRWRRRSARCWRPRWRPAGGCRGRRGGGWWDCTRAQPALLVAGDAAGAAAAGGGGGGWALCCPS